MLLVQHSVSAGSSQNTSLGQTGLGHGWQHRSAIRKFTARLPVLISDDPVVETVGTEH